MAVKEINFYRRWKEQPQKKEHNKLFLRTAIPYISLILAGTVICGVLFAGNFSLQTQIDRIVSWCEIPQNLDRESEALQKQALNQSLLADEAAVKELRKITHSYPVVNSEVVQGITAAGGGDITLKMDSYTAETGVLIFTAQSPVVIDIPVYIRRLEETKLFCVVDYSGYGFDVKNNMYAIHVVCSLDANAGKEGEK